MSSSVAYDSAGVAAAMHGAERASRAYSGLHRPCPATGMSVTVNGKKLLSSVGRVRRRSTTRRQAAQLCASYRAQGRHLLRPAQMRRDQAGLAWKK